MVKRLFCLLGLLIGVCGSSGAMSSTEVQNRVRDVVISDVNEFLQLDEAQCESIESITFENVDLNEDCWMHAEVAWRIPNIHFINCRLVEEEVFFFCILDSWRIKNLSIVNCGLTAYDFEMVWRLLPQEVSSLNFSGNNLGKQEPSTLSIISGRRYVEIDSLDLRDNNYTDDARQELRAYKQTPCTPIRELRI